MKIKKIVKLKSNKYKIIFDNNENIITYDNVILNNNLLFCKEIDEQFFSNIKSENEYYSLLNDSINLITKRLRSEKEIRIYLEKKTVDTHLIDAIIIELKKQKLINDQLFAKAYINDKLNLSNTGILKIKKDLEKYGIEYEIIEEECSKIDYKKNTDKLEKLISKKIRMNNKYSNNTLKEKILHDMLNLGYDYDLIIDIFNKNMINDQDIYKKQYEIIYNKLKNKYQGKELEYQINKRLYSKGFIHK